MKPVRLGIIGCGVIGNHHLAGATSSPLIDIVAVADLIEERGRQAAEKYGVKKVYREGKDLLGDAGVEAIVLAFPAAGRCELALAAFARGLHVLTEKPVAMNAGEVKQMIAAKGSLTAACCSSRFRFFASAQVITDFITTGALGDLRLIRCRAIRACGGPPTAPPPEWRLKKHRNGGGILMNWGCYDLDYLLGITGWSLRPQTVFAQTFTIPPQFADRADEGSDAETYFASLTRCAGGTMISFERGEFMPAAIDEAWGIVGTKGSLRMIMTPAKGKQVFHDDTSAAEGVITRVLWEGNDEHATVHEGPTHDFAAAIREGRPPRTTLKQALIVQQISDAIYASAASGDAVSIG